MSLGIIEMHNTELIAFFKQAKYTGLFPRQRQ